MTPVEFYYWLECRHPEIIPFGFGMMPVNSDTINLIGKQVGFREILSFDSRTKTILELKDFIERKYEHP